jgi:mannosyltransferase OCH1-like enzyme
MIPRTLFRTVPAITTPEVEGWWNEAKLIHPTWQHVTVREPVDASQFPISSPYWDRCTSGAQKAGLIRLELIATYGGIYLDSDVQVFRSFEPLRAAELFAGWEDERVIPDAVFGAEADHPVVREMLAIACTLVELGQGAWASGPGVFTDVLQHCNRAVVLPPLAFYPYHYSQKHLRNNDHAAWPWCFCAHHWFGSWVTAPR